MLELHSTLKHMKNNSLIQRSVGSSRICRMKKEFLNINLINKIRKLRLSNHQERFHSGVEERRIRSKKKRMMFKMSSMFLINTKIGSSRMQKVSLFIVLLHNAMERTSETQRSRLALMMILRHTWQTSNHCGLIHLNKVAKRSELS